MWVTALCQYTWLVQNESERRRRQLHYFCVNPELLHLKTYHCYVCRERIADQNLPKAQSQSRSKSLVDVTPLDFATVSFGSFPHYAWPSGCLMIRKLTFGISQSALGHISYLPRAQGLRLLSECLLSNKKSPISHRLRSRNGNQRSSLFTIGTMRRDGDYAFDRRATVADKASTRSGSSSYASEAAATSRNT